LFGLVRLNWGVAVALACGLVGSVPANAATQTAQVSANVVKPLTIKWLQDLDFGSITIALGSWSNATVSLSQAGVLTCANANLTCTGAVKPAKYNVQGSNNQTVRISAPNVVMRNQADPTKTLTLVTNAPATIALTSSGIPGNDFAIGGSITLNSTTPAGTYVGTFNVTVDY
jgi:spore coat protein U-like protein